MSNMRTDCISASVVVQVLLALLCAAVLSCYADEIRIGYLYDEGDTDQDLVYQYGIDSVNRHHLLKPHRLASAKDRVVPSDTFQISQTTCSLLASSVVGIFGPVDPVSSSYVQSVCDTKEIPHIESGHDAFTQRGTCSVNLHPLPSTLANIYVDLIKARNWKDFMILYEDNYSLTRLQSVLKAFGGTKHKVYMRQLDPYFHMNYRSTLIDVKQLGVRNFVIDCSIESLPEVLKQVQQVGLMTGEQHIIVMNLDLHTVDLAPFKYAGTNITGMRMFSCDSTNVAEAVSELKLRKQTFHQPGKSVMHTVNQPPCPLKANHALIIDAIMLFALALKEFNKFHKFESKPLFCNSTDNWEHGYSIINYMKMKTLHGLTGEIKFDHEGFRTDFLIDVMELTEDGLNKVGEWNSTEGLKIFRQEAPVAPDDGTLSNKTMTVIICLTDPYGMLKEDSNMLKGNDRFEGFGIDLIYELSQMLGFKYIFRVQEDGANGALNRETGKWDGMIRELLEFRADLAITDLTITSERESAVDFTHPFMNLGISVLYKKPMKLSPSFFSFTSPFSREVWFLLGASYFGVSLMLFVMGRLCPAEWRNPNPCIQSPEYLINQFSFRNSFWFTLASLMQQGSEIAPGAISTRMVAGLWWFFTLIMVSTYQANLAASLTVETKSASFSDIHGLVDKLEKGEVIAGAKAGGATANFFRDSNEVPYQKIWKYMESHPNAMTANNSRGADRANKEDYAFFMESTTIEFTTQRECNLTQVGKLLDDKGYGIALRQNSSYRNLLSTAIVKLQETGKLAALKVKWWNEKRVGISCSAKSESKVAPALNLQNLGGVFLVLVVGTLAAFAFVFVESTLHVIKESILHKLCLREELKREFEFFFTFRGMVKNVRKRRKSICSMNSEYATLPYGYANSHL